MKEENKSSSSVKSVEEEVAKEVDEVSEPTKKKKSVTLKINGNVIMVAILIILIFTSVIQAVELSDLKGKVLAGEVQAATTGSSSSSGSSSTPANLQDLPAMVGGC